MDEDVGSVITVNGRISPDELGVTLPHEHLFLDGRDAWFEPPSSAYDRKLSQEPVSIETLWWVRQNAEYSEDNLRLGSLEEAIDETSRFQRTGGRTIVDVTPKHIGIDPLRVRQVANATGLQFVHGTAYYIRSAHPGRIDDMSVDDLEAEFVSDVRDGIDGTDVRAGLVGEIGVSGHVHEQEEKVLRAGARAALRTGAPLMIHPPGRTPHAQRDRTYTSSRWGLELLDLVEEEGIPADRVVVCHMDRTLYEDIEYIRELAARGAYVEFDLWGLECYLQEYDDGYPSDHWRAETVRDLMVDGHTDRLLFSHDVHMKIQRTRYGGFGYGHINENVVPMLLARGLTRADIETVLVENPRRLLTFREPAD
jgi:phosphotriesterase-related protein